VTSVQKLSRIILICREAEQLAEFYIRAFGFVLIEDSPKSDPGFAELIGFADGQVRLTSLRLGNQVISLAETQPPGRSYPRDVPGWDPRFQHFAIVVSDMIAAYADLQAVRNWTAISTDGPQILPPSSGGVTAFKFRDPEGHPLEHWGDACPLGIQVGQPLSGHRSFRNFRGRYKRKRCVLQPTGAGAHRK
jgi:catechol 2,3-dioxygenase-like lactoylglutathione lyase family enzyme